MSAEYEIRTVADFAKVPADRLDDCLADFVIYLNRAREFASIGAELADMFGIPADALTYNAEVFHWMDDGIRGISSVQFSDETGNVLGRFDVGGAA